MVRPGESRFRQSFLQGSCLKLCAGTWGCGAHGIFLRSWGPVVCLQARDGAAPVLRWLLTDLSSGIHRCLHSLVSVECSLFFPWAPWWEPRGLGWTGGVYPRSLCWGPTPQAIVHLLLSHGHRALWSKVKHTVAALEHKNTPGCYVTHVSGPPVTARGGVFK